MPSRPSFTSKAIIVAAIAASAPSLPTRLNGELRDALLAQQDMRPVQPRSPYVGPAPAPSPAERVGPNQYRIGKILVDTAKKELSVAGVVNDASTLEFLANTKGGWKAYESALELETTAVDFNVACLLIGLDPKGAVVARRQFDPEPPQGQPVEMFIEWGEGARRRHIRAEQLIYDRVTKQTLTEGPWVYTGSVFQEANTYLAETEGTLVGFMHTTAPIIESPRPLVGVYGNSVINPDLNLKPGVSISLILRALPKTTAAK